MNVKSPYRESICIICTTPLSIHFFLRPHIKELSKKFDVTILTNLEVDNFSSLLGLDVMLVSIGIQRKISLFKDFLVLIGLCFHFLMNDYSLVWAVGPKAGLLGLLAAKFSGIRRRLFIFQGEVWSSKVGTMKNILKFMDKVTVFSSTDLLAVSNSEKRFLVEEGVVKNNQIDVLGSGSISGVDISSFDLSSFDKRSFKKNIGIPEDALILLFIGRLNEDKGIRDLANAFAKISAHYPTLWLVIVGPDEGKVSIDIEKILLESTKRFKILGFTETPFNYYAIADILSLPSYREAFPVSILEAGFFEVPAVGSDIYGISDAIIPGETGLLHTPKSVDEISKLVIFLIDNPDIRKIMGNNAKRRVISEFNQKDVVDRYVRHINHLLEISKRKANK
jgi:glycosyltransferase involved in cell wall biosynthesis